MSPHCFFNHSRSQYHLQCRRKCPASSLPHFATFTSQLREPTRQSWEHRRAPPSGSLALVDLTANPLANNARTIDMQTGQAAGVKCVDWVLILVLVLAIPL